VRVDAVAQLEDVALGAREALAGAGFHIHDSKVSQEREMRSGVTAVSGTWIMRRRISRSGGPRASSAGRGCPAVSLLTDLMSHIEVTRMIMMKPASISHAKAHLSALLLRVRAGQTVVITDRGTPVARLEPIATVDWNAELRSLIESGVVAPPRNPSGKDWFKKLPPAPALPPGVSLVDALLAEREEG